MSYWRFPGGAVSNRSFSRANLPYVECLIKEVYRFYPIAPLGMPHRLTEDDEYRGTLIAYNSLIHSTQTRTLSRISNSEGIVCHDEQLVRLQGSFGR